MYYYMLLHSSQLQKPTPSFPRKVRKNPTLRQSRSHVSSGPSVPSFWPNSNAGTAFFISPHQRDCFTSILRPTASWRET